MVTVYHNEDFLSYSFLDEHQAKEMLGRQKPDRLVKVAEVATDDLDEAFRLTNHIDSNWCRNKGVTCLVPGRSTSVGDVMEKDGVRYLVASMGFTKL